jgi:hypothetical protein
MPRVAVPGTGAGWQMPVGLNVVDQQNQTLPLLCERSENKIT